MDPIAVKGGPLTAQQGGLSLILSPEPGVVDVCLVGIREYGISGTGTIASVTFKVLAEGQAMIGFGEVEARDQANRSKCALAGAPEASANDANSSASP